MRNAMTGNASVGVMTEKEKKEHHESSSEKVERELHDELEHHRIRHTTKDMGL